jgi:hypothetical protein
LFAKATVEHLVRTTGWGLDVAGAGTARETFIAGFAAAAAFAVPHTASSPAPIASTSASRSPCDPIPASRPDRPIADR